MMFLPTINNTYTFFRMPASASTMALTPALTGTSVLSLRILSSVIHCLSERRIRGYNNLGLNERWMILTLWDHLADCFCSLLWKLLKLAGRVLGIRGVYSI